MKINDSNYDVIEAPVFHCWRVLEREEETEAKDVYVNLFDEKYSIPDENNGVGCVGKTLNQLVGPNNLDWAIYRRVYFQQLALDDGVAKGDIVLAKGANLNKLDGMNHAVIPNLLFGYNVKSVLMNYAQGCTAWRPIDQDHHSRVPRRRSKRLPLP